MPDFPKLVIDIGTNSILALLSVNEGGHLRVLSDRKITTKLGEGLIDTGRISPAAMKHGIEAVTEFLETSDYSSVEIVATEALRKAENSSDFVDSVKSITGQTVNIISGEKEAELSYLGGIYGMSLNDNSVLLVDVGGGSTEFVIGEAGKIQYSISVPIGALKLRDSVSDDNLQKYAEFAGNLLNQSIDILLLSKTETFVATGGTITSTAAMVSGLSEYDASKVHGKLLTNDNFINIAGKFEHADNAERESMMPFDKKRIDLILPGLGIFTAIMSILNKETVLVSNGGLRFGVALRPDLV